MGNVCYSINVLPQEEEDNQCVQGSSQSIEVASKERRIVSVLLNRIQGRHKISPLGSSLTLGPSEVVQPAGNSTEGILEEPVEEEPLTTELMNLKESERDSLCKELQDLEFDEMSCATCGSDHHSTKEIELESISDDEVPECQRDQI